MKLSREEVEHVALLARLALSEEEKERFRTQLSSILEYVEIISRLETAQIEPIYHVLPLQNVFRPDGIKKPFSRKEVLQNAPEQDDGYFKVPRII